MQCRLSIRRWYRIWRRLSSTTRCSRRWTNRSCQRSWNSMKLCTTNGSRSKVNRSCVRTWLKRNMGWRFSHTIMGIGSSMRNMTRRCSRCKSGCRGISGTNRSCHRTWRRNRRNRTQNSLMRRGPSKRSKGGKSATPVPPPPPPSQNRRHDKRTA